MILKGEIGSFLPQNDSLKPNFLLGENEIFGEMGIINNSLRTAKAFTMTDSNLIKISKYDNPEKQMEKSRSFFTKQTKQWTPSKLVLIILHEFKNIIRWFYFGLLKRR